MLLGVPAYVLENCTLDIKLKGSRAARRASKAGPSELASQKRLERSPQNREVMGSKPTGYRSVYRRHLQQCMQLCLRLRDPVGRLPTL
jgi:hypothetical protein